MVDDATSRTIEAVLDLPGFRVLTAGEYGGELEVLVETTATVVHCGRCGRRAAAHARREHLLRDVPVSGRSAVLVWVKRVWRCRNPGCPTVTWTESSPLAASRAVLTQRAKAWVARWVGANGETVAAVARMLGLGWRTVMRAVVEVGEPLIDAATRIDGVGGLGVDGHAWQRVSRTRPTRWATGIVDITFGRPARLLDVVPGRSGAAYADWLSQRDRSWREQIRVAALDPFRGYLTALRGQLPETTHVLDALARHPARDAGPRRGPPPGPAADPAPARPHRRPPVRGPARATPTRRPADPQSPGQAASRPGHRRPRRRSRHRMVGRPTDLPRLRHPRPGRRQNPRRRPHPETRQLPRARGRSPRAHPGSASTPAYFDTGRTTNGPTEACSSKRSAASGTATATGTTTDSGSCCTAESNGLPSSHQGSGGAIHG
ncbi:MAG: hypothetical protein DIU79_16145 [Actinobacteria bacterium]|nr:MAG: hypothetical protein DIU79_16145 [Actinomycetota bacterium]